MSDFSGGTLLITGGTGSFTFGLKSGTDFAAGISGVILVHNVAERGKIIIPSGTIHAVIDGDKAHATLTQDFHNLTDFQIVTTHAAHVFLCQVGTKKFLRFYKPFIGG